MEDRKMAQTQGSLKLTIQQQVVIDYLKRGSTLTNKVAITCLGVGSLSSRVAELRRLGFSIVDRLDTDRDGRSFKKYDLKSAEVVGKWEDQRVV